MMKNMLYKGLLLVMACLLLTGGGPLALAEQDAAWAGPHGFNIYPEGDQAAFDQALMEDRLALVPLDFSFSLGGAAVLAEINRYFDALAQADPALDTREALLDKYPIGDTLDFSLSDLHGAASYLSLSPDGRSLFVILEGIPFVLGLEDGFLRLLAPETGVNPTYIKAVFPKALHTVQDGGVVWSPGGSHLALANPQQVMVYAFPAINILLADVQAGSFRLVDPLLPPDLRMMDKGHLTGFPFRAAFSQVAPVLYYEVYGILKGDERESEIRSLNLITGEDAPYAGTRPELTTADPALWHTPEGILQTVAAITRDGKRGLALISPGGDTLYLSLDLEEPSQRTIVQFQLPSYANGRGVLLAYRAGKAGRYHETFQLFDMANHQDGLFDSHLALWPDKGHDQRVAPLSLAGLDMEGMEALYQEPGLMLPVNAVLSPDGSHLALAGVYGDEARLYILDIQQGIAGRVDVTAAGVKNAISFAPFARLTNRLAKGLVWSDNNRLLVHSDGSYRLYGLAVVD